MRIGLCGALALLVGCATEGAPEKESATGGALRKDQKERSAVTSTAMRPPLSAEIEAAERPARGGPVGSPLSVRTPSDSPAQARPVVAIPASEWKGLNARIVDPGGKALRHFFSALSRTARGDAGAITRVTHFGTSLLGADGPTAEIRKRMQARFGRAGKGWVNAAPGWKWYEPRDVRYRHRGWRGRNVVSNHLRDGHYGLGGVCGLASRSASVTWEAEADTLDLYYRGLPNGGRLTVRVDEQPPVIVEVKDAAAADAFRLFRAAGPGRHRFRVEATGAVRLYGATLERRAKAGLVWDSIPLIGARGERLLNFDAPHLSRQVARRAPDLIVAMFGGNELAERRMNLKVYGRRYAEAIRRLRAGRPEASCLVISPPDHGRRMRGTVRTDPLLLKITEVQRGLARELGCAFLNGISVMGGPGSAARGARRKPKTYYVDYTHLTPSGDRLLGGQIAKALLRSFAHSPHALRARAPVVER